MSKENIVENISEEDALNAVSNLFENVLRKHYPEGYVERITRKLRPRVETAVRELNKFAKKFNLHVSLKYIPDFPDWCELYFVKTVSVESRRAFCYEITVELSRRVIHFAVISNFVSICSAYYSEFKEIYNSLCALFGDPKGTHTLVEVIAYWVMPLIPFHEEENENEIEIE